MINTGQIAATKYDQNRYSGVRRLWIMVIIRAVFDYVHKKDATTKYGKLEAAQAKAWLFDAKGMDSLDYVCKLAGGLSADVVREYARTVNKNDLKSFKLAERDLVDVHV